jgi:quinol monooxygenase YgiN
VTGARNAVAHGVLSVRCADRARVLAVFEEDYRHLVKDPDFLGARLVVSGSDPDLYFHLTDWASQEAFAAAVKDPVVLRILGELPADAELSPAACTPLLRAADGTVEYVGEGPDGV